MVLLFSLFIGSKYPSSSVNPSIQYAIDRGPDKQPNVTTKLSHQGKEGVGIVLSANLEIKHHLFLLHWSLESELYNDLYSP